MGTTSFGLNFLRNRFRILCTANTSVCTVKTVIVIEDLLRKVFVFHEIFCAHQRKHLFVYRGFVKFPPSVIIILTMLTGMRIF